MAAPFYSTPQYAALVTGSHAIEVDITLLDLAHRPVGSVSDKLLDGQVTVDANADVTRSVELDLLDPTGSLSLDTNSPNAGALFADRLVSVTYSIINAEGTLRYSIPVFTGPITRVERAGAVLRVEAQGKEVYGLTRAWSQKTWNKGVLVTGIIWAIVREMMGESAERYKVSGLDYRTNRVVSVGGDEDTPWKVAKSLASGIDRQLYYDGSGVVRLRRIPDASSWTFYSGPGGSVKTEPEVGFSLENTFNAVEVWGKKLKNRPHARLVAPKTHPLSPFWPDGIGRPDGPRYLPIVIEDEGITTNAEAKTRARNRLDAGLRESIEVTYDALVIPHLQELDAVTCKTEKWQGQHRLRKFAIPLTSGGDMSIGYVRRVTPDRSAIRRRS